MFNELNQIPQKTFRFLKVNSLALKDIFIPEFKNSPLEIPEGNSKVKIEEFKNIDVKIPSHGVTSMKEFKNLELNDGFNIEIQENHKEENIIFVNIKLSKDAPSLLSSNKITLKKGASANIVLNIESVDKEYGLYFSNTEIEVEEGANLRLTRIQRLNNSSINIEGYVTKVNKFGEINFSSVDLGGKKNILNFHKDLDEEAKGNLYQLYLGKDDKVIDINKYINFKGAFSNGNMETKGVLLDNSKKTLRFTLDFKKGAKKSIGNEDEYVMLLSPKAKNLSAPLLLAGENDVKGNHAASIGKISEDSLFYLMSRGLSEREAKALIIKGALTPIIHTLPEPYLRELVLNEIERSVMV
ncbi:MAG: SufB/SufD family protein [Clostridium sp.]